MGLHQPIRLVIPMKHLGSQMRSSRTHTSIILVWRLGLQLNMEPAFMVRV